MPDVNHDREHDGLRSEAPESCVWCLSPRAGGRREQGRREQGRREKEVRGEGGGSEGGGGRARDLAWSPRALSPTWEVRGGALYPGRLEAQQTLVITTVVIGAPLVAQLVKNLPAM